MVMYIPIESELNSDRIFKSSRKIGIITKNYMYYLKGTIFKIPKKILYIHPVRKLFFHEKSLFSQGIYFRL